MGKNSLRHPAPALVALGSGVDGNPGGDHVCLVVAIRKPVILGGMGWDGCGGMGWDGVRWVRCGAVRGGWCSMAARFCAGVPIGLLMFHVKLHPELSPCSPSFRS